MNFRPVGDHIDGPDISGAYTFVVPEGADRLMVQALDQNLRMTFEGTIPTATKGFQVTAGDTWIFPVTPDTTVKVIEEAATCDMQAQFGSSKA